MTKEKSRLWDTKCSLANASKRFMASRKVPALRTCSQVRVVRLAVELYVSQCSNPVSTLSCVGFGLQLEIGLFACHLLHNGVIGVLMGLTSTLSRCNWMADQQMSSMALMTMELTSSQDLASKRIHPSSITSAESLVT